jgi:serine/threonine protein kinase/Flp pilus assembly protein TadD
MNAEQPDQDATLPLPDREQLDEIRDRFEAALKAGQQPHIDDYLGDVSEPARNVLRERLEQLQADYGPTAAEIGRAPDCTNTWAAGQATATQQRLQIERFHDKGGLGEIYVADDSQLDRQVAVKVLQNRHADNEGVRSRFVLEAKITGGLEHPGIIPIYGLGRDDDGRPFYAMRFVRGNSLKEAISRFHKDDRSGQKQGERTLELRKLLDRFLDVCHAMHYAHSRGILHRDLKPGNIMLGKYGETLIVDWGFAKMIGRAEDIATTSEPSLHPTVDSGQAETRKGSAVGTPAYMSPEQAAGLVDELGPASDIYSLGATLYTLLTNKPPFVDQHGGIRELLVRYRRGESAPTPPRRIQPDIPPALESICLRAMARRPEDRYPSPAALAEDIQHWLADEPVAAYPESWREKSRRWTKQHRNWVGAGAAALLLVAVVSTAASFLIHRAYTRAIDAEAKAQNLLLRSIDAEEKAQKNLLLATLAKNEALRVFRNVRDVWDELVAATEHGLGPDLAAYPAVREYRTILLTLLANRYEELAAPASGDMSLEMERGRCYRQAGDICRRYLLDMSNAERLHRSAVALFADLARNYPGNSEVRFELAVSRTMLGEVLAASQNDEADDAYITSITELRRLLNDEPGSPQYHGALGKSLFHRGTLLHRMGDPDAEDVLGESIVKLELAFLALSDELQYKRALLAAQQLLATILVRNGRQLRAEAHCRSAIATLDEFVREHPDNRHFQDSLAAAKIYLARVLGALGKHLEEWRAYREALADLDRLCRDFPDESSYHENLAIAHTDLGISLHQTGRAREAGDHVGQALPIFERLAQQYPRFPRHDEQVATSLDTFGYILNDNDRTDEAKQKCERSFTAFEDLVAHFPGVPGYQERLATCASHHAQVLQKLGMHSAAESVFRDAIRILEELHKSSPMNARYLDTLAFVHMYQGTMQWDLQNSEESHKAYRQARDSWKQLVSQSPTPEFLNNFARFLVSCPDPSIRDSEVAIQHATQAVAMAPANADYQSTLGAAFHRAGRWQDCISAVRKATVLRDSDHAFDTFFLAMAEHEQGNHDAAKESYQLACGWMEENCPGHSGLRRLREEARQLLGLPTDEAAQTDQP